MNFKVAANMVLIAHSFGYNMKGIRWGYEHGSYSKQFDIIADLMVQIPLPVTIMLDFKMVAEMAIAEFSLDSTKKFWVYS